ncbi:MAG: hypothetical protein ACLS3M_08640, partial [Collinsella sp.]
TPQGDSTPLWRIGFNWAFEISKPSQHSMKIAILTKSVECCDAFRRGRCGFRYGRCGFAVEPPARRPRYVFAAFG